MLGGELRECEELLYAFFEDAPEAIFLSECEGYDCRWTLLNEAGCRMLGYAREELVGAQLEFNARAEQMLGRPRDANGELQGRLLDGQPADPDQLPIVEALRGHRVVGAEFLARNVSGGLTPIGLNAGPIVGPSGEVQGAVAVFEDITATKELERLRAEWSSVVAHDLRQPLGSCAAAPNKLPSSGLAGPSRYARPRSCSRRTPIPIAWRR